MTDQLLQERLERGLGQHMLVLDAPAAPGTTAVASPLRLATEWAGYQLSIGGKAYYAKVLHEDMRDWIDPRKVIEVSHIAAAQGVTPMLRCSAADEAVMIFSGLSPQWHWAKVSDIAAVDRLGQLLELKKTLHQGGKASFFLTPIEDIRWLLDRCREHAVPLPKDADWLSTCAAMAAQAIDAAGYDRVTVHGDGVASNVLIGPDQSMQLIDFDRAGLFDPWHDLATTLNELYQFESEWRQGIEIWAGQCREEDYARCRLHAFLDDWLWTLWGFSAGETSSRNVEFSKVGQWTLLRCRDAVADSRFESWLRQV